MKHRFLTYAFIVISLPAIVSCYRQPDVGARYCLPDKADSKTSYVGLSITVDDVRNGIVYLKQRREYANPGLGAIYEWGIEQAGTRRLSSSEMSVEKFNQFISSEGYSASKCKTLAEQALKVLDEMAARVAAEKERKAKEAAEKERRSKELLSKFATDTVFCKIKPGKDSLLSSVTFHKVREEGKTDNYGTSSDVSINLRVSVGYFNSETKEVIPELNFKRETEVISMRVGSIDADDLLIGQEACEKKVMDSLDRIKEFAETVKPYVGKIGCEKRQHGDVYDAFRAIGIRQAQQEQPIKWFSYPTLILNKIESVDSDGKIERYGWTTYRNFLGLKWDKDECLSILKKQNQEPHF